jgi:cytochrome c553
VSSSGAGCHRPWQGGHRPWQGVIVRGRFRLLFACCAIFYPMRRVLTAATILGLAAMLAACGSSGSASAGSGSASSSARFQARLQLAKCARSHGINIPDPPPTGRFGAEVIQALQKYPESQIRTVFRECRAYALQAFPALNVSPAERAQLQQQLVKFAQCMRSHGLDVPDPTFQTGGAFGFRQAFRALDRNSPAFQSALNACRSLRPHFGHFRS